MYYPIFLNHWYLVNGIEGSYTKLEKSCLFLLDFRYIVLVNRVMGI